MNNRNNKMRKFTIIDFPNIGENYGIYLSNRPIEAAHKAFHRLLNTITLNKDEFIVFTIMDIQSNREYHYIGTPIELIKPIKIEKSNKKIEYKYRYIVEPYTGDLEEYRLK